MTNDGHERVILLNQRHTCVIIAPSLRKNISHKRARTTAMLHYPSRGEREKIFEALPGIRESLHSGWAKFIKGLDQAKISPFLHIHQRDEKVLIFHSLSLKKILGGERLRQFIEELSALDTFDFFFAQWKARALGDPTRVLDELMEKHFFEMKDRENHQREMSCSMHGWKPPRIPRALFISLTGEDLPHCDYQVASFPMGPPGGPMTPERLEQTMQLWEKMIGAINEPLTIVLSAGTGKELNKRELSRAMGALEQRLSGPVFQNRSVRIIVLARAEAIDGGVADILAPAKPHAYLTLDTSTMCSTAGPHDWHECLKGYALLAGRIPLCVPVIPLWGEEEQLLNFIEFLAAEYRPPYVRLQAGAVPAPENAAAGGAAAARLYMSIFRRLRQMGIKDTNMGRRLWSFVAESPVIAKCALFGGQLSVNPDGSLGSCPHLLSRGAFRTGHLDDLKGQHRRATKRAGDEKSLVPPLHREECRQCKAIGICGGGCPCLSTSIHGEFKPQDPYHCSFMRALVEALADELIIHCGEKVNAR
jgi:radical SAM protein with 4Fe4S-binding SPASM domain